MKTLITLMLYGIIGTLSWTNTLYPQDNTPHTLSKSSNISKTNIVQFVQRKLLSHVQFSQDFLTLHIKQARTGTFRVRIYDLNLERIVLTHDGELLFHCKPERPRCFQPIGREGIRDAYLKQLSVDIEDTSDVNRIKRALKDLVKAIKEEEKKKFGY